MITSLPREIELPCDQFMVSNTSPELRVRAIYQELLKLKERKDLRVI